MPLEGHWDRQQTPLRGISARERRVLAVVAALLVALSVALLVHGLASSSSPSASAACVDVTAASTLGGAKVHACGAEATRVCRSAGAGSSPLAVALRPQCRRLHLPVGVSGAAAEPGSGTP
jgi:hypothetical protein